LLNVTFWDDDLVPVSRTTCAGMTAPFGYGRRLESCALLLSCP